MEDDDSYLQAAQIKWEAFNDIKDKLPKKLIDLYNQKELFHGMKIYGISISKISGDKYSCARMEIGQSSKSEHYIFKYCGIDQIHIELNDDPHYGDHDYMKVCLLDELYMEGDLFCHNIMLFDGKEINVRCHCVDIEVVTNNKDLASA
jgi:hypothetical protein